MRHFRAVVHLAAEDEATARAIIAALERKYESADPRAPYVTVLELEPRLHPPGKHGWGYR